MVVFLYIVLKIVDGLCLLQGRLSKRIADRFTTVLIRKVAPTRRRCTKRKSYFKFFNLNFLLIAIMKPFLLLKLYQLVSPVSIEAFCTV